MYKERNLMFRPSTLTSLRIGTVEEELLKQSSELKEQSIPCPWMNERFGWIHDLSMKCI